MFDEETAKDVAEYYEMLELVTPEAISNYAERLPDDDRKFFENLDIQEQIKFCALCTLLCPLVTDEARAKARKMLHR